MTDPDFFERCRHLEEQKAELRVALADRETALAASAETVVKQRAEMRRMTACIDGLRCDLRRADARLNLVG